MGSSAQDPVCVSFPPTNMTATEIAKRIIRNKKGQFIKGTNPFPQTQFQKGKPSPRKGRKKPGWTNDTSFKTGSKPWNTGKKRPQIADDKHPMWKGDEVGYSGLHTWVRRKLGTPQYCEFCKSSKDKTYHWANKSQTYKRELTDWIRLCISCHKKYDMQWVEAKRIAKLIVVVTKRGNVTYLCGNGGSADMAAHFSGELVGYFEKERKAIPALSLTNTVIITAVANDVGYEKTFSRQVEAYGRPGDLLIVLTTSDSTPKSKHSLNLLRALQQAKLSLMNTVVIGSEKTKLLTKFSNATLKVTGKTTAEIQDKQLEFIHNICRQVEEEFLDN